jgi:HEAT repeat protein
LVSSPNPDDRDTALAIIEVLGDDDAVRMAVLLDDKWTYIRLEAATVLRRFYPNEVARCLRHLLQEEAKSVRETASKLLVEMGEDSREPDRR